MSATAEPLHPPQRLRAGHLPIDRAITVRIPDGWSLLAGGGESRPRVGDVSAFTELTDDSIVATMSTRAHDGDPDALLAEVIGPIDDEAHATIRMLQLPRHVRGRAAHMVDDAGAWFVATLVVAAPRHDPRRTIGVEIVADGPADALHARLPMLQSMIASVQLRRAG